MVEAIFDFKDINRRMNRKPALVYDPMTDEMVTPSELANRQADRMIGFDPAKPIKLSLIPSIYTYIDQVKKGSDQTVIARPSDFTVIDKAEYEKARIAYSKLSPAERKQTW